VPVDELITSAGGLALFVDRAQAVRPDFALNPEQRRGWSRRSAAGWKACRWRSSSRPPATRLLDPAALLARLTTSLDVLSISAADLPGRQQTLRGHGGVEREPAR